jgi:hypothetical protein
LIADNTETEHAMKHNIEQQKIREQRWQRRSEQAKMHKPKLDVCAAKTIEAQDAKP